MIKILTIYRRLLSYPKILLLIVLSITLVASYQVQYFTFDASADTLVVKGDPKLAIYQKMSDLFGGDEFLVLAYSPREGELFSRPVLDRLAQLQQEVTSIDGVAGVFSILDAPLVESPPIPLNEMSTGYKTLRDSSVDLALARTELTTSPLFCDFLVSSDGESSVIRIDLDNDKRLMELLRQRDELRIGIDVDRVTLEKAEEDYRLAREAYVQRRDRLIKDVRGARAHYTEDARIFISGVPMIAADMIEFVKSDLVIFGNLVFAMTLVLLFFFFRRLRWVVLPVLVSAVSITITVGILGFARIPVTVISSNFISLLAIICISFSIHLIVRYRELRDDDPLEENVELVQKTMESKFAPCVYTGLTTMLAFGSMMASRIVPVEDFGWMMCLGIVIAFLVTYSLFPALLLILGKGKPSSTLGNRIQLTIILSHFCLQHSRKVLITCFLVFIIAIGGLTRLSFENRFVDYFDDDTDIHQGMVYIDDNLGGTLPFDVYLQLGQFESVSADDDFFSGPSDDSWPERYWFTNARINVIADLHEMIEAMNSTGKVVSISTLERLAREFNNDERMTNFEMAYVLKELPAAVREQLVLPYARPATGYARINVRVKESGPNFSRNAMILAIYKHATVQQGIDEDKVIVTGMMVLFNDMLKQLANSQMQTLLYVVITTFLMFALLLRSALLALLALIPNVIAAATVISVMGYAKIPMDMMTITIAAISIGIGVDDAIHYLHRFREEYSEGKDVRDSVKEAHLTIGRAMYFTSMIIIMGFSILTFSNFLPTVYFGLLTALAMLLALLANLTVLPSLLIHFYATNSRIR